MLFSFVEVLFSSVEAIKSKQDDSYLLIRWQVRGTRIIAYVTQ